MPFNKPTNGVTTDYPQQIGRLIDLAEGPARRNFIRNGDFQIAQRGTSFAGITSEQYTLDGWRAGAAGTSTVTQETFTVGQTDVPDNPVNFCRVVRSVAAGAANDVLSHRIEFPARLSGKTVTVSFRAKVSSGTKALVFDLASSGVTSSVDTSDNSFTATTTWTLFSASIAVPAMTAATSSAYLALRIREAASFGTFTLDIADVQLEEGSEATRFERLNFEDQLLWNQRFFCKSFALATAPAQNVGATGAHRLVQVVGAAASQCFGNIAFPLRMRTAPTVTIYNPSAANAQVRNNSVTADCSGSSSSNVHEGGFTITATTAAGSAAGHENAVHWSATAEL